MNVLACTFYLERILGFDLKSIQTLVLGLESKIKQTMWQESKK